MERTTPSSWTRPLFVYIRCPKCRQFQRLDEYKTGFLIDSKKQRHRSAYGLCPKCGKELSHRIDTEAQILKLVKQTTDGYTRDRDSLAITSKKEEPKKMAKAATKAKKTEKAEKVSKKTKPVKAAKAEKTTKKAKKTEAVERSARYGKRKEGMPTGVEGMISIIDGEFKTVEEFNKDYAKAAKAGKVMSREDGWKTTDLSWLLNKKDNVVAGFDSNGERVYGANLKVKNGKADGIKIANNTAELKDLKPSK